MIEIIRSGHFDAAHRVMNEKVKCFNIHGHTYKYELVFREVKRDDIGYAMDAKEVKRIACTWIDEFLDHSVILNPKDEKMLDVAKDLNSKVWIMSLEGQEYCNPSVENIASEIYIVMSLLFAQSNIEIASVKVYETPNFSTICYDVPHSDNVTNFLELKGNSILQWRTKQGEVVYDDRLEESNNQ